jgi:CDP-diacylglycerol--glycerol-3-phosphate 3-phosphatidyltransferase
MLAFLITFARLPLAGAFAVIVAVLAGRPSVPAAWAIALFGVAACEELSDFLDGLVARKTGTASPLGGILDPLADSLARLTMYFAMALAGWITIAVPLAMTARDIVVAYTRIVQALTGGKTSARTSGKLKAFVQGAGIFIIIILGLAASQARLDPNLVQVLRAVIAALIIAVTSWSLLDYIHGAGPGIRILRR